MSTRRRTLVIAGTIAMLLSCVPSQARAEGDDGGLGLTIDLGLATSYVFRGWNLFQKDDQQDVALLLSPSVAWSIFDSGVTVGYWGAFQISGPNIQGNIDAALGLESDLFVLYDLALPADLTLGFALTAYLYPAADEAVVGASFPAYIEPAARLTWSSVVDVSLGLAYFFGVQDQPAIRGISYLYLNPTVSKSFPLLPILSLDVKAGYGFKVFQEGNGGRSNVHDLLVGVALPIRPWGGLYVTPAVSAAWTDVEGKAFAKEIVVWGGLNVGYTF